MEEVSNLKAKHLCKTQFVVVILNDDVSHIWRAIIKWLFEKKNKVILWAASNSAQSTPKIHFAKGGTIKATTLHSKKEISHLEFSDRCQKILFLQSDHTKAISNIYFLVKYRVLFGPLIELK